MTDGWSITYGPSTGPGWEVTLHRRGQQFSARLPKRGAATPPTLNEALHCLVSDAGCVRHGQTFREFCEAHDYDTEDPRAEDLFIACLDALDGLSLLGCDFEATAAEAGCDA